MNALLIDDEQPNLDNLRTLLGTYCPQVTVCATALNAEAARGLLYQYQPDLVFLDIQMPGESGFDWLRSLPGYDFAVIIVTAYDQYAIQAMRLAAVDYLLKPVDTGELQSAVDRASRQRRLRGQTDQLAHLLHLLKTRPPGEEPRVALATAKETRLVYLSGIIRCESANNYTTFFLSDGDALLVCRPLYEYDELLTDYGFVRCHQSHLVNKKWIKSWKKADGDFLLLTDGSDVPVSRGKKEATRQALNLL